MQNQIINEFVTISQYAGKSILFVQGGGGNTSSKVDNKMYIKASGTLLKDMSNDTGYSVVDFPSIREYLDTPDVATKAYDKDIVNFVIETDKKPSIETGFHATIPYVHVAHTHSMFANILNCCEQGFEIIKQLFPDAVIVPYHTPGLELILAVKKSIQGQNAKIIFLENHGLIVASDDVDEVIALHEHVNNTIKQHLNISDQFINDFQSVTDIDFMQKHILFPDQIVFTFGDSDKLNSKSAQETIYIYNMIIQIVKNAGLNLKCLPETEAHKILNMDSEKFRLQISK